MNAPDKPRMKDGIIKRGRTYTYVVHERDPKTGEKRPRWVGGFPTRRAAKQARDAARASIHSGTYVAPQDLTVSTWLRDWMDGHEVSLKPSTAYSYRDKIRLYLDPAIGHERVQSLSPSRLSGVWKELQAHGGRGGKPVSVRTVIFARSVLRKAMEDAVIERIIQVNPVVGSKVPKRDGKPKHTTWTGSQLAVFLGHVADDRWMPMWHVFASTGMRRGEVAGLTWGCVDLDAAVIRVEVSTTQLGRERVTTTPKNHERRTIAIDAELVSALRSWKSTQARERLQWGPSYADREGLVFTWEDGRPILPDFITKSFKKIQQAVEAARVDSDAADALPLLVVHELRHSHATILLRQGVPVHIVAKRLGHKDPSVTLDVYADVIPEDDASAVDAFSLAVWGA